LGRPCGSARPEVDPEGYRSGSPMRGRGGLSVGVGVDHRPVKNGPLRAGLDNPSPGRSQGVQPDGILLTKGGPWRGGVLGLGEGTAPGPCPPPPRAPSPPGGRGGCPRPEGRPSLRSQAATWAPDSPHGGCEGEKGRREGSGGGGGRRNGLETVVCTRPWKPERRCEYIPDRDCFGIA